MAELTISASVGAGGANKPDGLNIGAPARYVPSGGGVIITGGKK